MRGEDGFDGATAPKAARRGRRRDQKRAVFAAPAYVTRNIPFVEFMGEAGLERIEAQADWILQEVGIEFRDDPQALERWKAAGADVRETRVRFPAGMVRELCKTAPSEFVQQARNPARSTPIGGNHQVYAPVYGPPFVRDLEGGRRYGTLEDFENFVKLAHMLPAIHNSGFVVCEPCDAPVSKRHLDMVYAHMRWTDKPHLGAITEPARAVDSVTMAKILHGGSEEADISDRCVIMAMVNTNSPLVIDKVVTGAIEAYSGAGQGIIGSAFILSGAMAPSTMAAAIAQALAETMACCAYTQLVRPGAPFVLGSFLSSMSLKSGAPTFGTPEPSQALYVITQLARRLGVPVRCGGSLTASKIPDAQAAAESADSMSATAMAGANFVLHSAGWLEGGLCSGYEKLILDADRLGGYQTMLAGMAADDNAIGQSAYADTEPGGHFLGSGHTMANYQTAFHEMTMSDSNSFEQWEQDGSQESYARAHARWKQMLADYEAPAIDPATDDALKDFVARRKSELPDAWC